jgi:hypothetical protein
MGASGPMCWRYHSAPVHLSQQVAAADATPLDHRGSGALSQSTPPNLSGMDCRLSENAFDRSNLNYLIRYRL